MRSLAFAAAWAAGSAGAAPLACDFDLECLEGEACAVADYALDVGEMASDVSGSYPVTALPGGGVVWEADGATTLLTVAESGRARLSVHLPEADLSIFYRGVCWAEGG